MIDYCGTRALALTALLAFAATASAQNPPQVSVQEPRTFGYHVGDTVERHIIVVAVPPLRLAKDSLPKTGRVGHAMELGETALSSTATADGTRYELRLRYQIFLAPPELKTLDLPAFTLRFDGGARPEEARIDYWPVTVGPLVPVELSPRTGLESLRPDVPPPLLDTLPTRIRLWLYGTGIVLLLLYLAHVHVGLRLLGRRARPFARAYREVKTLANDYSPEAFPRACRRTHRAFDETAGSTLFADSLDPFLVAQPRFAPLRQDIAGFFERSKAAFFAGHGTAAEDLHWLVAFCRQCRDAERRAA